MVCEGCNTFGGTPLCGACRAIVRLQLLVKEGGLRANQESVVVGILRSAVGALQDLCEDSGVKTPSGGGAPAWLTGTPTGGGGPAEVPPKKEKPEEKKGEPGAASSGAGGERVAEREESSSFESEEEEEAVEDQEVNPLPVARGSLGRALLGLKATGKVKAAPVDTKERKLHRRDEDRERHHRSREVRQARGHDGEVRDNREELPRIRTGDHRPPEPDHPPPNYRGEKKEKRRSRSRRRRKERKSKGKKKRERGQAWRDAKAAETPQEEQWRQKQKRA